MSDNKPSKLDMDIINMVQNARMMHDNEAVPSKVPGVYWIEAKNPNADQSPTARAGEFQISTNVDDVDAQWATIKSATEAGQLGYKSKVSTSPTDGTPHGKQRLIVVRTIDAEDKDDVQRVENQLRDLGFEAMVYVRI
ncbi:MAG: putative phosphothreonine lyase domain-containing protein [Chloroflexota bacterium]